jgi:antitoxin component YwqK of YwqJK toxin-antitoxin module
MKNKKIIYLSILLVIGVVTAFLCFNIYVKETTKVYYSESNAVKKVSVYYFGELVSVKGYYENGNLKGEINYKNGKPEGVWKNYHENGDLKNEVNYKDGKFEGVRKSYNQQNGNLVGEENYKNGKLDGVLKLYHENGDLYMEINYKNGQVVN